MRRGFTIASEELIERFAVGEIEAAASRHQELAPGRRHALVDRDLRAARRQNLSRHQPRWTGTDNRDIQDAQPPIDGSLMPAAFAACSTYLKVWKNAPPRSRAVDISPILAKFAAIASGVH